MHDTGSWVRRSPATVVITGISLVYVALTVGPLCGLFTYAPFASLFCPATLEVARRTLGLTLLTSTVATAAGLVIGLPTALCLARVPFRGRSVVNALIELPISLPPLVLGVGLLLVWGRRGLFGQHLGSPLSFTIWAVMIAQFVVASPFLVRIAKAAIEQVPRSLEDASRTLGAAPTATYLRVTFPLARTGILTAIITCWARAMGEFGATIMFAGNFPGRTQTAPLAIFNTMQYNVTVSVGLSVMVLLLSIIAFVSAQMCISRAERPGGLGI